MKNLQFYDLLSETLSVPEQKVLITIIEMDKYFGDWATSGGFEKFIDDNNYQFSGANLFDFSLVSLDLKREVLTLNPREKEYLPRAVKAYEEIRQSRKELLDFKEASLISLALFERWIRTKNWSGLFSEIKITSKNIEGWKIVFSIIFSATNYDPFFLDTILENLVPSLALPILFHVVNTQLLSNEKKSQQLKNLYNKLDKSLKISWLQILYLRSPELAKLIVEPKKIENLDSNENNFQIISDFKTVNDQFFDLIISGYIYLIHNSNHLASLAFDKASNISKRILEDIELLKYSNTNSDNLLQIEQKINFDSDFVSDVFQSMKKEDLAVNGVNQGMVYRLETLLDLFNTGDRIRAVELAKLEFNDWYSELLSRGEDFETSLYLSSLNSSYIISLLEQFGLTEEIDHYFGLVARYTECYPQIKNSMLAYYEKNFNHEKIYQALKLSLVKTPNQKEKHQLLIKLLEDARFWPSAVNEWNRYASEFELGFQEWLHYSKTACKANDKKIANVILDKLKKSNLDQNKLLFLKGTIAYLEGKKDEAKEYLKGAIKFYPEEADAWIYLSKLYKGENNFDNALSTLKSGIFASPDSSDLYFHLAELYLENQSFSEAIKNLKNAVALNPHNSELYYPLIDTLQIVGLWEEAMKYLSFARSKWPNDRKFAFLEAKRQLSEGDNKEAIKLLKIATDGDINIVPYEWYLLLIRTLLNNGQEEWLLSSTYSISQENLLLSRKTLQNLLNKKETEGELEVKIWLAEIYYLIGEFEHSLRLFEDVFEKTKQNANSFELIWRIFAGLGVLRSEQSRFDEALVLLAQAAKLKSDNWGIKRNLAENYLKANLSDEAFKTANEIWLNNKEDLLTILWFAEFMKKINKTKERIVALEQATKFIHHKPVINNQLAEEYISIGQDEDAIAILEKIFALENVEYQDIRQAVTSLLRINRSEQALNFYQRGISTKYNVDLGAFTELIYLHFINQNWEALSGLFSEGYIFNQEDYGIFDVIKGEVYKKLGNNEQAILSFEKSLEKKFGIAEKLLHELKTPIFVPEKWLSDYEDIRKINLELVFLAVQEGNTEKATNQIELIKQSYPSDKSVLFLQVDLLIQSNQIDDALLALRQIPLEPNLPQGDLELYRAYDVFLTYLVNESFNSPEFIGYQNGVFGQIIDSFIFAQENQFLYAKKQFTSIDEILLSHKVIENNNLRVEDLCQKLIMLRLMLFTANLLYDYSMLDRIFKVMLTFEAFRNELPYYQFIFNIQNSINLKLFTELNVFLPKSEYLFSMTGKHTIDLTLTPIVEKMPVSTLKRSVLEFLSDFETASIEKLTTYQQLSIPGINSLIISKLINDGQLDLVKNYLNQNESLLENTLFALSIMENNPLEAKLTLDRLPDFDHPIFLFIKGLVNIKNNFVDVAILEMNKAISIMPEQTYWKYELAISLSKSQRYDEAKILWLELMTIKSNIAKKEIIKHLLNILIETNSLSEAENILESNKNDLSDDREIYILQTKLYFNMQNYNKVLEICSKADRLFKDDAKFIWWKAKACFQLGDYEKSALFAKDYIHIYPMDSEGNNLYLQSLLKSGNNLEALNHINSILSSGNNQPGLSLLKLKILAQMERYEEAIRFSSEIKDEFYNDQEFNATLAELYFGVGDYYSAEQSAKAVIRGDEVSYPQIRLLLAKILEGQGKLDQSLQYLGQAIKNHELDSQPYIEMGRIYNRMRDFQKALTAYQEAIKINNADPAAYYEAGLIMREIKDYQGAEKMLRIASELNPKDANIRKLLAGVIALNFVHTNAEAD